MGSKYHAYALNLEDTVLFKGLNAIQIEHLLEAMNPTICEGQHHPDADGIHRTFRIVASCEPTPPKATREFPYSSHGFCEPGMIMGEIPAFSLKDYFLKRTPLSLKPAYPNLDYSIVCIEFSPEQFCICPNNSILHEHGILMRNMMGFLAQKVIDSRRDYYLLKGEWDMYSKENRRHCDEAEQ